MGLSSNIFVYKCILLFNRDLFNCNLFEYCGLLPIVYMYKDEYEMHVELYFKSLTQRLVQQFRNGMGTGQFKKMNFSKDLKWKLVK